MRNRRVSTKTSAPAAKMTGVWMLLMLVFIVELFFYTWCRVQCTNLGYRISQLNVAQGKILERRKNLKLELARLKSPARIEKIASEQLGLVIPRQEQIIRLK